MEISRLVFREAVPGDIPGIQIVRHLVKENMLSDPSLVTDADCHEYMFSRGKGWVCENHGTIIGFAIADLIDNNIWALFIDPVYEGHGIGKKLHQLMMDWYFMQGKDSVWLGTAPHTRAAKFYEMNGWRNTGMVNKGELKFEMNRDEWGKS